MGGRHKINNHIHTHKSTITNCDVGAVKERFREPWEKSKGKLGLIQGKKKLINVINYEV